MAEYDRIARLPVMQEIVPTHVHPIPFARSSGPNSLRRQPPVHSPIHAADLAGALASVWSETRAGNALASARALLERVYPGRTATLTSSGTVALTLALRASAKSAERIVALPAYACPDVGTAAIGAGFRIVLYDVDAESFEPEIAGIAACIARGATHVVVTHLCGRIVDVAKVAKLTEAAGVVLIEDAAQHAGGTLRGVRAGGLARWSVLSFGRGKGLNAGGGGALLHAGEAAGRLDSSGARSQKAALWLKATATSLLSTPGLFWLPASVPGLGLGETAYHEPRPPSQMSPVSASLLPGVFAAEPSLLSRRQDNEEFFISRLTELSSIGLVKLNTEATSGALRFPILIAPERVRSLVPEGVVRLYPRTLLAYPPIAAALAEATGEFPGADRLAAGLHTLPTHGFIKHRDRQVIVNGLVAAGPAA